MPPRSSRRRTRRQVVHRPEFLPLEPRVLLADGRNVFAHLIGRIDSFPGSDSALIQVGSGDFSLSRRQVVLGVLATGDPAGLDPGLIRVTPLGRARRHVLLQKQNTAGSQASLTLASVSAGTFELKVNSQRGTTGPYQFEVYLAGDANGDYRVDHTDLSLIRSFLPRGHGRFSRGFLTPGGYDLEADANRDGRITAHDYLVVLRNLGASTQIRPLTLTALDPASDPDGDGRVASDSVLLVGQARPGAEIELDRGGDGTIEQTTQADSQGRFTFAVVLDLSR